MPTMVTMNEAAKKTGIPYSALRRWIKSGEFIYYVMVGTRYLINLERLVEFLNAPATVAVSSRYSPGGDVRCNNEGI